MIGRRHEIARMQSDFYRDNYRKILRWLFICVIIMIVLIVAILYLILYRPAQQYYANTVDGKVIPLVVHT